MINQEICLLNDGFPPIIDGVSNVVVNYGGILTEKGIKAAVAAPDVEGADDSAYPFPVLRYQSLDLREQIGYTVGNPFSLSLMHRLREHDIGLVHSHCPMMSQFLARQIREMQDVPVVMTYHTKYDIDIANALKGKLLQKGAVSALVENVSACDELWVVSRGAGENIRSLGYQGDYIVMENGVDMPKKRASEEEIQKACYGYDLPENVPLFLFVGRLMWYKGIRIILDALKALDSQEVDFRMVFVGSGKDEQEIRKTAEDYGLFKKVFFTGPVSERNVLQAWYSRADMFLFPSTFDTNGLVVREASASGLASVLIKNSAAAEGVSDGVNGVLIEENAASLAVCLMKLIHTEGAMRTIGEKASEDLYLSWDTAVSRAVERYEIVIDNYKSGRYPKHTNPADTLFRLKDGVTELFERFRDPDTAEMADWF